MSHDVKNIYSSRQIKEQETEITGTCRSTVISPLLIKEVHFNSTHYCVDRKLKVSHCICG